MFDTNRLRRLITVAVYAGTVLLFAACASAPPAPTASLNDAKVAIRAAEKDDATHFASAELDQARQKLILADKAVVAKEMILADRYAQESTVAANLAVARTEASKAVAINQEMRRSAEALIEEMQRAGERL
jgi:hypothetical protein